MYKYSDERRNDPELREKVAKIHEDRRDMILKVAKELEAIKEKMYALKLDEDDGLYEQAYEAVWSAYYGVGRVSQSYRRPTTDCYIGNLAAGELGEYVIKKGL